VDKRSESQGEGSQRREKKAAKVRLGKGSTLEYCAMVDVTWSAKAAESACCGGQPSMSTWPYMTKVGAGGLGAGMAITSSVTVVGAGGCTQGRERGTGREHHTNVNTRTQRRERER